MTTADTSRPDATPVYLVGIDASDVAERALTYACEQAGRARARIVLAHVVPWSPYAFMTPEDNEQRHAQRAREIEAAHAQLLEPAAAQVRERGLEAATVVRHGDVARTLDELAAEYEADQIVVGKSGDAGLGARFVGSVASKLVQIALVPVTFIP